MGLDEKKIIDLKKYGLDGTIEMAYPTLRRKDKFARLATAMMIKGGRDPTVDSSQILDAQFVQKFAFIEKAPFDTLDGFYTFTDELDDIRRGAGEEFKEEFIRVADEIASGKTSPSAGSPTAE